MGRKEKVIDFFSSEDTEEKTEETSSNNEDAAILFSSKVVGLLKEKMKEHNRNHPEAKVSLSDLKSVYRRGAETNDRTKPLGLRALARVGMYLRMKIGYSEEGFRDLLFQVELKDSLDYMKQSSIDISDSLLPHEEDFLLAQEEIEKNELNYDFNNVNELYLDDYEKGSWKWQW